MGEGNALKDVRKIENVYVLASASVVGREEWRGPFGRCFDFHDESNRFGAKTWEKAEGEMQSIALSLALKKEGAYDMPDFLFSGDLQNQCVASAQGLVGYKIPYFGLYGACSTITEGLCLASLLLGGEMAERVGVVTSSHTAAAERQFRLPLEYGGQRPPTAQWTATASAAFILGRGKRTPVRIRAVAAGRMIDGGIRDASHMGAAMAPAAADSILRFLSSTKSSPEDYDHIVTGDLGIYGSELLLMLLSEEGVTVKNHLDCGSLLYDLASQDAHAGASGCGCSAAMLSAHFLPRLWRGELKRVLFLSTGAIMSPSSIAQGENIFGVAPAVLLEGGKEI